MASRQIRPIRVKGNIAYVPLTQGYESIIDAADVPLVEGRNWYAHIRLASNGSIRTVYAMTNTSLGSGKKTAVLLHRVIMSPPDGMEVDHIDGSGLNNRRSNLRNATDGENMHNQRIHCNNTSGFKGVSWDASRNKWQAKISVNRRTVHLGRFGTADAARDAYDEASERYHGSFGRTG